MGNLNGKNDDREGDGSNENDEKSAAATNKTNCKL